MQKVTFDYFTIDNYDQYSFLRIPKRLMTDDYYAGLSNPVEALIWASSGSYGADREERLV